MSTLLEPIRSEIFSASRLELHGQSLAHAQSVTDNPQQGKNLARRIADNRKTLEKNYAELLRASEEKRAITPAGEWLIDNFHVVRTQLKDIHDHLPPRFYRELPKLADGPLAGLPRVYGVSWAFVAHTDSRFDAELLKLFLKSYQTVQPLTIGELWSVATTLRVALIENLRRLTDRIVASQEARFDADQLVDELLKLTEKPERPISEIIADLDRVPFNAGFATQLLQRLRYQDASLDPVLEWLDAKLKKNGWTSELVVSAEHSAQTGANATVRNIITSTRMMSALNWNDFFEEISLVDRNLHQNPIYSSMDFPTRDRYRHAIEELARHSESGELEIVALLLKKTQETEDRRKSDPGFYLLGQGRSAFEAEIGFKGYLRLKVVRLYQTFATPLYLGAILVGTLALLAGLFVNGLRQGVPIEILSVLTALAFFPASEIGLAVVNRFTIALLGPKHLPRLTFPEGIPLETRTFVVVPTFLNDLKKIEMQLEQLEVHYLSNPQGELYFALLTDFADSATESRAGDRDLLEEANRQLSLLNSRYGLSPSGETRFFIFHRRRLYNPSEGKWIGWERKRGKLHEFNRLLMGEALGSFISINAKPVRVPQGVRYVITLDADTRLPMGAAKQLIGTMVHPLNEPRLDERTKRVVEGFGILQPRVTPALPSSRDSTVYQRLSAGPSGIDPYASAVSDVYQDLFGEGSYTGKGIYDVRVMEAALQSRIPENSLLSHDLFESCFARCGFLSDVELFEDFPSNSEVAVARSHRWMRGDWQLLPWILGRSGQAISVIGRWKMLDNLRRSLVAPATFLTIIVSLAMADANMWAWLLLSFVSLGVGALVSFAAEVLTIFTKSIFRERIILVLNDLYYGIATSVLFFILLPRHAVASVDAISRALYRLLISRRHMLEWTTAAQAAASANLKLTTFLKGMRWSLGVTALATVVLIWHALAHDHALHLVLVLPVLAVWLAAPFIARWASIPPKVKILRPLVPADIQYLHFAARRIWRFFATFVTEEDRHLPPDNFQEDPKAVVAHRSSPTNFGLYLLSVLAAHDFGWIGLLELGDRLDKTLKSMEELPRFNGHFYNWYETTGARALDPKYISSVDNGNLAGHLLTLAQGCTQILQRPLKANGFNRGTLDTLLLVEKALNQCDILPEINRAFSALAEKLVIPDHLLKDRDLHFSDLKKLSTDLRNKAEAYSKSRNSNSEVLAWITELDSEIQSSARDYLDLFAWSGFAAMSMPIFFENPEATLRWRSIQMDLSAAVPIEGVFNHTRAVLKQIEDLSAMLDKAEKAAVVTELEPLVSSLEACGVRAQALASKISEARETSYRLFREMDFSLLYDSKRELFSIGYRVAEGELDPSYYDLLASEARLTSFIAIAKGDVPVAHWFKLGRGLTPAGKGVALISWSGSMFEYLMPSLVMNNPPGSLIDQTCRLVIDKQIKYGADRRVPWGISESAYNKRDHDFTYQYSNFGVPDLALKRGLGADLVIAPYATILAAMYGEAQANHNLRRLERLGAMGPYGFYESVDFTERRLPKGQKYAVIKTYMAHHQGMSLVAIANIFHDGIMRERFQNEPLVQAAELLLQERTPRNVGVTKPAEDSNQLALIREQTDHISRRYHDVYRLVPTTQVLSNNEYSVMMTSSGAGYSRVRDLAVSRWREDVTRDCWGSFIYLRDTGSGRIWSAGFQPVCFDSESYEATFAEDRVNIRREDFEIQSELEVFLSPEDNAEIRRVTLTNMSGEIREIELTSYMEVVLNTQLADEAHPAFSNLFVQTKYLPDLNALIATRRPRSSSEKPVYLAHVILPDKHAIAAVQFDTNRESFIGRNRSTRNPIAIESNHLSGTEGSVLDPIFSLRTKVRLEPGVSARVTFSTIAADTREEVIQLADKFRDLATFERVSNLAWTQAQVELHFLNIESDEAHLFQRIGTRLFFSDPSLRPSSDRIKLNKKDVTGLWAHGISGDLPIILVRIDDVEDRGIVRQLLKAVEYFYLKRMAVDLVILNDRANSYAQELQQALEAMVHSRTVGASSKYGKVKGGIFTLRADALSPEDRGLLYASARIIFSSRQGSLAEQAKRVRSGFDVHSPELIQARIQSPIAEAPVIPDIEFANGIGGFCKNGTEYLIALKPGVETPAPWINVISNPSFGFQVSESGSGFTWSRNSREFQITPWSNDPVVDPVGECFYILDRNSGCLWSPTAKPIRFPKATYLCRHGQGYSQFNVEVARLESELTQFVMWNESVKVHRLRLKNLSDELRHLSVSYYADMVLGFNRSTMSPTTVTRYDEASGCLLASNSRSPEFGGNVVFAAFREGQDSYTGDRTEFIGRNGSLDQAIGPRRRDGLSNRSGSAMDPCLALQRKIRLQPGEEIELTLYLGEAESLDAAKELLSRIRRTENHLELKRVTDEWNLILGKVQVETPDVSMNIMLNSWLLYQTLVCRIWARSAFYQAGGAYGFRDQLQDAMALVISDPRILREQILRAAHRQYAEGDVQHWWHPPSGRGVRTHFSDDRVWLVYALLHYLKATGDYAILGVEVPFIESPSLRPDQEDSYSTPTVSLNAASLYDHCVRALNLSLAVGAHGLPLIGSGDWNDGMNRVGRDGKGESVWLAWFLVKNLRDFAQVADRLSDGDSATTWRAHADRLVASIEREAWDGEWYIRAFFDDGTPIGSHTQNECKIDSLAQSWSVLSGAGDPLRTSLAMHSAEKLLVKTKEKMVLLLEPPFDRTSNDPGYIKGYVPGVRENGGQYTHAAIWYAIAQATLGCGDKAHDIFSMLNPIHHSQSLAESRAYRLEPYALAADVYSLKEFEGRGGWSWYTGAAGWMYRAGIESILGLTLEGNELVLDPCIPEKWRFFKINYIHGTSTYEIHVQNPESRSSGVASVQIDGGVSQASNRIELLDDHEIHKVTVTMGARVEAKQSLPVEI